MDARLLQPCRACGTAPALLLDLGEHPLAGSFPAPGDVLAAEPRRPLRLVRCGSCGLVQLGDPSPDEPDLAGVGGAVTSVSPTLAAHARGMVADVLARGLAPDDALVVTTASHGNHLARFFAEAGRAATVAEEDDVAAAALAAGGVAAVPGGPVQPERALQGLGRPADLVVDHFLLAHLADPVHAIAGYRRLVRTGGTVVLEFDHWLPTFLGRQWDAVRHGHVTYLALEWLASALAEAGFVVEDAVPQDVYGGSLRVFARAVERGAGAVAGGEAVLHAEAAAGLGDAAALAAFGADVRACIAEARTFLRAARVSGRRVAAYGAPARGNTFLNAVGEEAGGIAYAVDASAAKHGRLLPGTGIPIRPPSALRDDPADDILILPWDLAPEIATALADVRAAGARLFVGMPMVRELEASA